MTQRRIRADKRQSKDRLLNSMSEVGKARQDYTMAKRSGAQNRHRAGVPSTGVSADYHYRRESDWRWMGELAWDLYRNNMALGSITDRAIENQLQGGFTYDPKTGDPKLDRDLKDWWTEIKEDPRECDPGAEINFTEQEEIVYRSTLVAGDIFGVPMEDGTVALIEAFLCRSPRVGRTGKAKIFHGIEKVPDSERRAAYWFVNNLSAGYDENMRTEKVSPLLAWTDDGERNVFHVRFAKRANQTRGLTAYTPLFDVAGYHDDVQFLKMVQARAASLFVFVRQRSAQFDPAYLSAEMPLGPDVTAEKAESANDAERQYDQVAAGSDIKSLPGETINPWSSNIPNPEFFPHAKLLLTFIGINLGMPLVMALMDASETNFSGYRGAVNQARLGFRANQKRIIAKFHVPYMRFKIYKRAESDPIFNRVLQRSLNPKTKINALKHRWNPPSWPYIEPTKDAQGDLLRIANMLSSPRRVAQERGMDFDEILEETIQDKAAQLRSAYSAAFGLIEEFKDFGEDGINMDVDTLALRLASMPTPDRTAVLLKTQEDTTEVPDEGADNTAASPNSQPGDDGNDD